MRYFDVVFEFLKKKKLRDNMYYFSKTGIKRIYIENTHADIFEDLTRIYYSERKVESDANRACYAYDIPYTDS